MPPLENTDRDSSLTSPPAAHAAKLRSKLMNILSWNMTDTIPPLDHAISLLTVSSTFSWTTLVHSALIMAKVPSQHDFSE